MTPLITAAVSAIAEEAKKLPKDLIVPDSVQNVKLRTILDNAFSPEYYKEMMPQVIDSVFWFGVKVILAVLIFFVGRWILRAINRDFERSFKARRIDISIRSFVKNLMLSIGYTILILAILAVFGIKISGISTIIAALGLGVGMALKDTLQNFAGGIIILALKPYRVGDYVKIGDNAGTVRHIRLFTTHITTIDNKAIYIPNGTIAASDVENFSSEPLRRVDWTISLSYGDSIDTAKEAILQILNADDRVIKEPTSPFVALSQMGDSSIVIIARAWTDNASYWNLYYDINEKLYTELPKHGLNFPFPQLDVHLKQNNSVN